MFATATPASDGSAGHSHGHHSSHSGYSQSRSHHRKAAPERIPVLNDNWSPPDSLGTSFDLTRNTESDAFQDGVRWARKSMDKPNGQSGEPNRNPPAGHRTTYSSSAPTENPSHTWKMASQAHQLHPLGNSYLSDIPPDAMDISRVAHKNHEREMASPLSALTSILIALPFVLSSFVLTSQLTPLESEKGGEKAVLVTDTSAPMATRSPSRFLSFLGVCSLTAATLVLVGFIGEVLGPTKARSGGRSEPKPSSEGLVSIGTVRRILGRILSIGLPFYATSKLGGERIAIVILVALAAELMSTNPKVEEISRPGGWSKLIWSRKWTVVALALQCACDLLNLTNNSLPMQTASGYLALAVSVLLLPWPYPTSTYSVSSINSPVVGRDSKGATAMASWEILPTTGLSNTRSPMISTARDTDLTVASGVLATVLSFIVFVLSSPQTQTLTLGLLLGGSIVAIASASSLLLANPKALLDHRGFTLATGLVFSIVIQELIDSHPLLPILFQSILILASWFGVFIDTYSQAHHHSHHSHHSHGSHSQHHSHDVPNSKFTSALLHLTEDWPLLHSILLEKDSRRILYFMSLNFAFMLIQTFYGWATGSLGLLSDSIHMFFDCAALVVGLGAAVLSKRPPSLRFPYGFEKMDTLAGFANGIFLMLISVEIVYEGLERLIEGSHMQRIGELLIVSILGLAVNLVGMFAFGHAHHGHGHSHSHGEHDHSHGGGGHSTHHDHCHDHSHEHDHDHAHHRNLASSLSSPLPITTPTTPSITVSNTHSHDHSHEHNHGHGHGHGHGHDHQNHGHHHHHHGHSHGHENMEGIFLHVLADTLGSVAVVVSTVLIHFTGWVGWDPIASCIIAILIFASAIPLVRSCAKDLLLIVPEATEFDLREALAGVGGLRGVANVCAPKFWVGSGEKGQVEGVMHIIASKGMDLDDVRERASAYLSDKRMSVLVQVERDGEGRCWCGGATKTS